MDDTAFRTRKKRTPTKEYLYLNTICIECEKTERKANRTPAYRKDYKARRKADDPLKHHLQERISQWRSKDTDSDLTVTYLAELYEKQQGKCYYTNQPMVIGGHKFDNRWEVLSLDRLDPNKGYKEGNVVWCTYRANTMKGNLTYDQFLALIQVITCNCKR